MAEILSFSAYQNKRIRLNQTAISAVARYVSLRPAPNEAATDFVARIVTSYLEEVKS